MENWKLVGDVRLLQMQKYAMTGRGGYDLNALVEADQLKLTSDGAFGLSNSGWIMDRHHRHHPDSKRWHASHTLSFGFTSHYDHMWDLFRATPLGVGGENIIVDAAEMLTIEEISGGLRIETDHGTVEFRSPEIAEPCVEFTRFMTDRGDANAKELKPWREQLRNGVRGFVVGIQHDEPFDIAPGDALFVRDGGE